MNEPLALWSRMLLRLGLVLVVLGFVPLVAVGYVFTGFDLLVPLLLALSVGPLGVVVVLAGLILSLAAAVRRRRGSS